MELPKDLPPIIPENDENMKNISQNSSEDAKIKEQEAQKRLKLEEEQKREFEKNMEKQKIQKIKESLTQIDMAKHPKPWLLVGQNLLDNNKQKVIELPNLEMSDGGNYDNVSAVRRGQEAVIMTVLVAMLVAVLAVAEWIGETRQPCKM